MTYQNNQPLNTVEFTIRQIVWILRKNRTVQVSTDLQKPVQRKLDALAIPYRMTPPAWIVDSFGTHVPTGNITRFDLI